MKLYEDARIKVKKNGGSILSDFSIETLTEYGKAVFSFVKLIVQDNFPLSIPENNRLRRFEAFYIPLSRKSVVDVLLYLLALDEELFGFSMKITKGAGCTDIRWLECVALNHI